jgi:hypothetical protein
MDLDFRVYDILEDARFDEDSCERSKSEVIYGFIPAVSWEGLLEILLKILKDKEKKHFWNVNTEVLYFDSNDKRPMPSNEIIARLFVCSADENGISDGNLVWSITRTLKGVSYTSDYDPVKDPAVWALIQEFSK